MKNTAPRGLAAPTNNAVTLSLNALVTAPQPTAQQKDLS